MLPNPAAGQDCARAGRQRNHSPLSVATGGGCWPRGAGGASAGMPRRLLRAELLPLLRMGTPRILPSAELLPLQRLPGRRAGRKHRVWQERS